ncbi:hypothetical protein H8356DRAFT_1016091 [Neocallimastix lanati (nom. inval.)]|nr:hypothetical protein H8356DRAFT_1016091 [Neocallimastix sp. JGI-2020a]
MESKKKNKRVTQACNYCKIKRVKCTGDCPCQKCLSNNIECIYSNSKKRGRKIKIDENKYLNRFSVACNFLNNGIPEHIPIMNNGDSKYDIFINYELIDNFYRNSTFEFIPFLNYSIINNRIRNKEIYFSLLFGLYAISELFSPYGDYNVGLKYMMISRRFLKLAYIYNKIRNIQVIETFFVLALFESGHIMDYLFSKWALRIFWSFNIFDIEVPEYKNEERSNEKYKYISLVYSTVIMKHMVSQITPYLVEYVELYDIAFENTTDYLNLIDCEQKEIDLYVNTYRFKPKLLLVDLIKTNESFSNTLKINKYTNKIDLNELLSLKYKKNVVISLSEIKSIEFSLYMNQPSRWLIVRYNIICRLRNTLFLFRNIKSKKLKFDASMFIEEDKEFIHLEENIPSEFRLSNSTYLTDPTRMYLYKCRFYSTFLSSRIFLYRAILRLVLNSISSLDLISNIKAFINNVNMCNDRNDKKRSISERNKHFYFEYINNNSNIYYNNNNNDYRSKPNNKNNKNNYNNYKTSNDNNNNNYNDSNNYNNNNNNYNNNNNNYNDSNNYNNSNNNNNNYNNNNNNNYNTNNDNNDNKEKKKVKYWINDINYMEMTNNELNDFISSCVYHQIVFILKNVLSKSIDFLLNQNMFYLRIAKKKESQINMIQYYEYPSVIALYEYGVVYLSKYVANYGNDYYNDNLITFSTDIHELNKKIKNNYDDNNWYIGRQEPYDTLSYLKNLNKENSNDNNKNNQNDNANNNYYYSNNEDYNNNNNKSFMETKVDYDYIDMKYNICDKILDLISHSEGRDDINLGEKLYKIIDMHYCQNIKEKCTGCKDCLNNHGSDNSKENFIEILKLLKYFCNLNEYIPNNCDIYKCRDHINNYIYFDSSIITYQYYFNELSKMEYYFKSIDTYIKNFKYLINKAKEALNQGIHMFDVDSNLESGFF